MAWLFLVIAGIGEVVGVLGINRFNQQRNLINSLLLCIGFVLSFIFLTIAMETIPMGTAYAIWTGIGTVGSALVGMILYGESRSWTRILFISMVLSAAIGLKLLA